MADNNIRLVYGGGSVGLMGAVADSVMAHGGTVFGVIPSFLHDKEVGHEGLSELVVTDSMHERKKLMFDKSDGFVTLAGGLGSLDETFEILTWKQLNLHEKPVYLLNTQNYWDGIEAFVRHTIAHGFASESAHDLYQIIDTPAEVVTQMLAHPLPPKGDSERL